MLTAILWWPTAAARPRKFARRPEHIAGTSDIAECFVIAIAQQHDSLIGFGRKRDCRPQSARWRYWWPLHQRRRRSGPSVADRSEAQAAAVAAKTDNPKLVARRHHELELLNLAARPILSIGNTDRDSSITATTATLCAAISPEICRPASITTRPMTHSARSVADAAPAHRIPARIAQNSRHRRDRHEHGAATAGSGGSNMAYPDGQRG